tara:strand:+ start:1750 stop:2970 length:1221 start_codon:yes stop_codon:yes gene_type:complete
MLNQFSVLFYPKRSDIDKQGKIPLYVRITVAGKRSESYIQRRIEPLSWNSEAGKAFGTTTNMRELNRYMDGIRSSLYKIHSRFIEQDAFFTARDIRDMYTGRNEKKKMLIEVFQDHNDELSRLVGTEYSPGTLTRYNTCKSHVEKYIKKEFKTDDIPLKDVDHQFISGFEYFLKTQKKCIHNTAVKYIINFKKIIRIAYANNWISKDPFIHWKATWKHQEREFLTQREMNVLEKKVFKVQRLEQVKDIFLFCCYTGLAYADVEKLNSDDILLGVDGRRWIKTKRKKTNTRSSIPLLPAAESILEKYEDHPLVKDKPRLLPVTSNQKSNAYLKEIAILCGINKNLTTHLARHTFATTVTLSNGVPIESVSKMLGHTSIKTTQHYAKVLDKKIGEDMEGIMERYTHNA